MILVLTGPKRGKTLILNGYKFIDGELDMRTVKAQDHPGILRYFSRSYKAALKGSEEERTFEAEYQEGLKLKEEEDAKRKALTATTQRTTDPVSSKPVAVRKRSPEGEPSGDGSGSTGSQGGDAGAGPAGDGHTDSRVPEDPEGSDSEPDPITTKVREAVMALDADNDDHWTRDGKPQVAAVAELSGVADLKRKGLDLIAGEYNREEAKKQTA